MKSPVRGENRDYFLHIFNFIITIEAQVLENVSEFTIIFYRNTHNLKLKSLSSAAFDILLISITLTYL